MKAENIIKIELQHAHEVLCLIKEAIVEMERQNIYQWDDVYPDHNTIIADISSGGMFGVFKNGNLAGIVVLDKNQPPEYSTIKWESGASIPLVMHRLCVRPKFQGQGIAKQLLTFSEQFAINNSFNSIILDAFSGNPAAINLYENNGYLKKGAVAFRKGEFYCYKKLI